MIVPFVQGFSFGAPQPQAHELLALPGEPTSVALGPQPCGHAKLGSVEKRTSDQPDGGAATHASSAPAQVDDEQVHAPPLEELEVFEVLEVLEELEEVDAADAVDAVLEVPAPAPLVEALAVDALVLLPPEAPTSW